MKDKYGRPLKEWGEALQKIKSVDEYIIEELQNNDVDIVAQSLAQLMLEKNSYISLI